MACGTENTVYDANEKNALRNLRALDVNPLIFRLRIKNHGYLSHSGWPTAKIVSPLSFALIMSKVRKLPILVQCRCVYSTWAFLRVKTIAVLFSILRLCH
jgi:hypothetical protein